MFNIDLVSVIMIESLKCDPCLSNFVSNWHTLSLRWQNFPTVSHFWMMLPMCVLFVFLTSGFNFNQHSITNHYQSTGDVCPHLKSHTWMTLTTQEINLWNQLVWDCEGNWTPAKIQFARFIYAELLWPLNIGICWNLPGLCGNWTPAEIQLWMSYVLRQLSCCDHKTLIYTAINILQVLIFWHVMRLCSQGDDDSFIVIRV